jgi:structural maintenance of chromosome 3 (chondroitin sulfate proteoglycan 6)
LIRSRTELQCIVSDLQSAADRAGGQREELENELGEVERLIIERESSLTALLPEWEAHRARENEVKKRMDEARVKLDALYGKRGRLEKFRTRAERDRYLKAEIASVEAYSTSQNNALQNARQELEQTKASLHEIGLRAESAIDRVEDGRKRAKDLGEQLAALKDEHSELTERRKELWREETKLKSLVDNEADELRSAERSLASMMDKVRHESIMISGL